MNSFIVDSSKPATSTFTCHTCGIKFAAADLQRQHMKTDWHRYNLKRKVAQLPSISSDVFAEKILDSQRRAEEQPEVDEFGFVIDTKRGGKRTLFTKKLEERTRRGRTFEASVRESRTESPYSVTSHLSEFSLGDSMAETFSNAETGSELNYTESDFTDLDGMYELDSETESWEEDMSETESLENVDIMPISHCFICGRNNHNAEENARHMFSSHGLYIPKRSYLSDLDGLLTYISEIITIYNECLVCNFQGKSLISIRQHMCSKGHCKLPYETKEEKLAIAQFYNFDSHTSLTHLPIHSRKHVSFEDQGEEVIVNVLPDLPTLADSIRDPISNDNYSLVHVDPTGVELTLPTGSRIGHRSMVRYYRQNVALPRENSESQRTVAVADRRFAPGLTLREVIKQQAQTQKQIQVARNIYERKSKPARINFQRHYRDELLGPM
ncbi:uncharacterized protein PRCAT00005152001 [Priceomyces carsonii]|uniref:uncharacterized protein n=1 Tax=Priceomyces carsonii TaxID=28549 RepID=UPI002ED82E1D|nr:unnamed protein product [Priceomyces carsonii]